jgi:hypothetical protein
MSSIRLSRQIRSFSSSSRLAAAAEVKRLGVIGAGQMVSIEGIWHVKGPEKMN